MAKKQEQKQKKEKREQKKTAPNAKKIQEQKMQEHEEDILHWADHIAKEVKARVDADPKLKKLVEKQGFIVYDEKTPSGKIHVGSGRGWIIHDAIAKAMRSQGMQATFILSSDDIDPYDKPNKELPSDWDKYLGMPFRNMPSPVPGYEHFGDYYFRQATEKFGELGIEAELESTGEQYEKGIFNKAIKTILDNHQKVQAIYKELYGEEAGGANKIPFNVICEKCGKIATTRATHWDAKKELLAYECKDDVVKWAQGCGHTGKVSPYNGNGKFPWKVEWAAKWPSKVVVCELAGKDHFTHGGSRTCAVKISSEVLDYPPPYPSTRTETGDGYEFFTIGGQKMSTSKGIGVAFADITNYLPPKIVRYLLIKTRPHAVLSFDPCKDDDIIFLFDRYDETERIYFKKEKASNPKEAKMQKRIYELSQVGPIPKKMPTQISFVFASVVIQTGLNEEGALKILRRLGHIPEDLEGHDMHAVMERLHDAKRWVERFASERYKFEVQSIGHAIKLKEDGLIGEKERKALLMVAQTVKKKKWDEKALHDEFYHICKKLNVDVKAFFQSAYKVLINKERGPRLASFVLTLGDRAVQLFETLEE